MNSYALYEDVEGARLRKMAQDKLEQEAQAQAPVDSESV
jgi:hypothetical protein